MKLKTFFERKNLLERVYRKSEKLEEIIVGILDGKLKEKFQIIEKVRNVKLRNVKPMPT